MRNIQESKLIQLLKVFSNKELKKIRQLADCKLFNVGIQQHQTNCQLLDYLLQFAPKYASPALEKQAIFKHLFPREKKYIDKKVRDVLSNVLKLVEDYIVVRQLKNNEITDKLSLLRFYQKNKLEQHFEDTQNLIFKWLTANQDCKNASYYQAAFALSEISLKLPKTRKKLVRKKQIDNINWLNEVIYNLDRFYLVQQLDFYCERLTRFKINNQYDEQTFLINKILEQIQDLSYLDSPIIRIYQNIALMLLQPTERRHFDTLKSILKQATQQLPSDVIHRPYIHARNYCIWKINAGQQEYLSELLEIYDTIIDKKWIELTPASFKNIITTGIRANKVAWTQDFINKNISSIKESFRTEVYNYSWAYLHFYDEDGVQKNYLKIINLLEDAQKKAVSNNIEVKKFNDIFYQIDARKLLLKTYFEINDVENTEKMFANLEVFLSIKKQVISQNKLKSHRNFIRIVKKIYKIVSYDYDRKQKIEALELEIDQTAHLTEKNWLKAKLLSHKKANKA